MRLIVFCSVYRVREVDGMKGCTDNVTDRLIQKNKIRQQKLDRIVLQLMFSFTTFKS